MEVSTPLIPSSIALFVLIVTRIGLVLTLLPGFGSQAVPLPARVPLAVVLALVLSPFAPAGDNALSLPFVFAVALAREIVIGLALGLAVAAVFAAIEMAASLIGYQLGFGLAATFNPAFGTHGTALNTLYLTLAALVLFGTNGHHLLIGALARTFALLPPGTRMPDADTPLALIGLTGAMFADALRIGLPIAGSLLVADIGLGLLNRMVPQMSVFFVGLPAKILLGFFVLLLSIPFLLQLLAGVTTDGLIGAVTRVLLAAR
ncbi:flagellar biosynthetic protein FliR [Thermomicrobium sp. 4228-Ro]|uniref:flagellar biosynthetic protein FliR n=1 Tax=Thermomicrobium sp. 4228-Ro TaxID=2993937 RepID=UPI002248A6D4|nr:flagellar biosynthetic protein FliR [Thermomicrobium sp. 4228-Ro]MCX2727950.1 flagellar biosynthetic protein FliR [Thermomicrobium sp. 4228-Ro]